MTPCLRQLWAFRLVMVIVLLLCWKVLLTVRDDSLRSHTYGFLLFLSRYISWKWNFRNIFFRRMCYHLVVHKWVLTEVGSGGYNTKVMLTRCRGWKLVEEGIFIFTVSTTEAKTQKTIWGFEAGQGNISFIIPIPITTQEVAAQRTSQLCNSVVEFHKFQPLSC